MKFKAECKKCKKQFTQGAHGKPYADQGKADQALRMHVARVHAKTIVTPSGPINTKARAAKARALNGFGHNVLVTEPPSASTDMRSREWRSANPKLAKPIGGRRAYRKKLHTPTTMALVIKHCPMCGCHIDDVAKGVAQGKLERGERV